MEGYESPNKDYLDGWYNGYWLGWDDAERVAQAEIERLKAENARLYKEAYFIIPIPNFLRRK